MFSVARAVHCSKFGNATSDTMASISLLLACSMSFAIIVEIEAYRQNWQCETSTNRRTLTNDNVQKHIKAGSLIESSFNRNFFDVKVFYPSAKS